VIERGPTSRPFDGTTAVVTGGASGIGAATVRRLADGGAFVVVADRDAEGAELMAKEVDGVPVAFDVADVGAVRAAFASVAADVGPVDVLVNNAGADRFAMFVDTDESDWDTVLAVNLKGGIACTHAVLPDMYRRRRGAIVNVASEAGRVGTVGGACYAAAKAGLIGFTMSIAREAARYDVRCNAVAPGPIETPLLESVVTGHPKGSQIKQGMVDATVMGRTGSPDDVAAAIAYLASDDAAFVTGHTLAVSGGLSMG
jgi:2-hydroxycyclohexanecarboxyl-CoA dehydrogenase